MASGIGLDESTREADLVSGTFSSAFLPLYRLVFDDDSQFVQTMEKKLAAARMPVTVELYLSKAFGVGAIVSFLLWLAGLALGYGLFATGAVTFESPISLGIPEGSALLDAKVPLLVFTTGLCCAVVGFTTAFGVFVARPYFRAASRRREINMLLADAVSFMYALSVGGIDRLEIFESVAAAEDTYGEVAREFQSIVQETEYFDTDYRTAITLQAEETPSREFRQFLVDMLSIINSGGDMTRFLEEKKRKHLRTAKLEQQRTLETLEMMTEMYITLSVFPLLLIIIIVIMSLLGRASTVLLMVLVYAVIPLTGLAFLVMVMTIKTEDYGDGYIRNEEHSEWFEARTRTGLLKVGLVEAFTGEYNLFDRIREHEGAYQARELVRRPHLFFRDNPMYTLAVTVPAALMLVGTAAYFGAIPTSWDGLIDRPVYGTFTLVYLPAFVIGVPLAVFYEWNVHSRRAVLGNLSDELRKLATVNDTGVTLLEAIGTVADSSRGKLAEEFRAIYRKVNYGMSLKESLIEFNNEYHIPRLARTVKLMAKAQEASSEITAVLSTAAQAAENQDDIDYERVSRTRMQIAIIMMTFVTMLGVMAVLKMEFVDALANLGATSGGAGGFGGVSFGAVDGGLISLMFFHTVTMQAVVSGLSSGYIRDGEFLAGVKYVVGLLVLALAVWAVVG